MFKFEGLLFLNQMYIDYGNLISFETVSFLLIYFYKSSNV